MTPASKTRTTLGWSRARSTSYSRASRRAALASTAGAGPSTLTAASAEVSTWRPRYTVPTPPRPMTDRISNGPTRCGGTASEDTGARR